MNYELTKWFAKRNWMKTESNHITNKNSCVMRENKEYFAIY